MEIKITATGAVVLTEELREFIERKIEKTGVFLNDDATAIAEVEVATTSAGQRTGDVFRTDIHVTFAGGDAYAEAVRDTLHAAIDQASAEVRREVRKRHAKNRDFIRRGAAQVKAFFRNFGK